MHENCIKIHKIKKNAQYLQNNTGKCKMMLKKNAEKSKIIRTNAEKYKKMQKIAK